VKDIILGWILVCLDIRVMIMSLTHWSGQATAMSDLFLNLSSLFRTRLTYHSDDGGSKSLWYIHQFLPDYTAQHHRIFVLAAVRIWNLTEYFKFKYVQIHAWKFTDPLTGLAKKFPAIMEPKHSSSYSQKPTNWLYPEAVQSNPQFTTYFSKIKFCGVLASTPWSPLRVSDETIWIVHVQYAC
jgi:hypothetical protein